MSCVGVRSWKTALLPGIDKIHHCHAHQSQRAADVSMEWLLKCPLLSRRDHGLSGLSFIRYVIEHSCWTFAFVGYSAYQTDLHAMVAITETPRGIRKTWRESQKKPRVQKNARFLLQKMGILESPWRLIKETRELFFLHNFLSNDSADSWFFR